MSSSVGALGQEMMLSSVTCSYFLTEAMHWIKEVEMVDSVDDLMSSSSVSEIRMPNFEVLDARILQY